MESPGFSGHFSSISHVKINFSSARIRVVGARGHSLQSDGSLTVSLRQ
jgi:hypothetical protein